MTFLAMVLFRLHYLVKLMVQLPYFILFILNVFLNMWLIKIISCVTSLVVCSVFNSVNFATKIKLKVWKREVN